MKRRYTAPSTSRPSTGSARRPRGSRLSSDFIVGFPGETEEDFEATLELVRRVRFASLFGFRYSPRPGTAAARWGEDSEVPESVSAERLTRLLDLQAGLQREINEELVGTRVRDPHRGRGPPRPEQRPNVLQSNRPRRTAERASRARRVRDRADRSRPARTRFSGGSRDNLDPGSQGGGMIKMEIKGLLMDPVSNMPVVILRDTEKGHFLPIWVGIFEANAIALEMEKVQTPRPMTHDLLKNVLARARHARRARRHQRPAREHVLRPDPSDPEGFHPARSTAGRPTRSPWRCARRPRSSWKRRFSRRAGPCTPTAPSRIPIACASGSKKSSPDELGKYRM